MKINKKKNTKKIILVAVIAATLLTGSVTTAYFVLDSGNSSEQDSTTSSGRENKKEDNNKIPDTKEPDRDTDTSQAPELKEQPQNTDQPPAPPVENGTRQLQIFSQHDISSGNVNIRGGINSIESGGNCTARLIGPNGQVVEKNTSLLANPSTTDCRTISIPQSELVPGNWRYTLNYTSPDAEGSSDEKTFIIQ